MRCHGDVKVARLTPILHIVSILRVTDHVVGHRAEVLRILRHYVMVVICVAREIVTREAHVELASVVFFGAPDPGDLVLDGPVLGGVLVDVSQGGRIVEHIRLLVRPHVRAQIRDVIQFGAIKVCLNRNAVKVLVVRICCEEPAELEVGALGQPVCFEDQ